MKRILWICLFFLVSCTTQLTTTAENIRVTNNPEAVRGCQYLKTIHHRSLSGGVMFDGSENAMNKIRNEAAELGGDIVLLVSESGTNQTGISVTAEVYKKLEKNR
jgi:hypothetical protein